MDRVLSNYLIPAGNGKSELTEKRSRFLGHLSSVKTEDAAKDFISEMKRQYHDARHNCWCYRIIDGPDRFSDDGEPQGSAGIPMLEVFRRENISNLVCVVTRYFGGVLLGTGGLSRAYAQAAKEALVSAGTLQTGFVCELRFSCPYGLLDRVKNELLQAGVIPVCEYAGAVSVRAEATVTMAPLLADKIRELSSGGISVAVSEPFLKAE